jgi:hypothetical protein
LLVPCDEMLLCSLHSDLVAGDCRSTILGKTYPADSFQSHKFSDESHWKDDGENEDWFFDDGRDSRHSRYLASRA